MTGQQEIGVDWKAAYGEALRSIGVDVQAPPGKRKEPRFTFTPPEKVLLVQVGPAVGALQDISLGGVSFHLPHRLAVGRRVDIQFDHRFKAAVEVVGNYLEDFETRGIRTHHRNRTRFLSEEDAYRCVVKTLGICSLLLRI